MNNHPTPIKWMGQTIKQNQILRYIDRENPFGDIVAVKPSGPDRLTVTDVYCIDHTLICMGDGNVQCLDDREEVPE